MKQIYKLKINGFGSEVTIGNLSNEQITKIKDLRTSLTEGVLQVFDWQEMDDVYHNYGACSDYLITITDANGKDIYEIYSEDIQKSNDVDFQIQNNFIKIDSNKNQLICISFQKGLIYETEIQTTEFDLKKLKVVIDNEIGIGNYFWGSMLRAIYYDDQEYENIGQYTDEKSFEAYVNLI